MARRLVSSTSPLTLGNGDQAQEQATPHGHLKVGSGDGDLISVTFTCDTSAYASGDLIADPTAITGAVGIQGGIGMLDSVTIIDEDAQGVKLYLVFTSVSTTFGTLNSAANISDANLRNVLGIVTVLTTDYVTVSGTSIASIGGLGKMLKAASGATTIYCAVVNATGTPTFTASGLKAKFGIKQF